MTMENVIRVLLVVVIVVLMIGLVVLDYRYEKVFIRLDGRTPLQRHLRLRMAFPRPDLTEEEREEFHTIQMKRLFAFIVTFVFIAFALAVLGAI